MFQHFQFYSTWRNLFQKLSLCCVWAHTNIHTCMHAYVHVCMHIHRYTFICVGFRLKFSFLTVSCEEFYILACSLFPCYWGENKGLYMEKHWNHNLVEVWYSLEQYIGLKEDKLSSTTVDFIRSEGNLETKHLYWLVSLRCAKTVITGKN